MKPIQVAIGAASLALLAARSRRKKPALKVVTWNIQGGYSAPTSEGVYDPMAQASLLQSLQADIIALQETDPNISAQIAQSTGMQAEGSGALALLVSRRFIIFRSAPPSGFDDAYQRIILRSATGTFAVYNFHAARFDLERRQAQIARLRMIAELEKYPVLIMGDFNESNAVALMGSSLSTLRTGKTFTPIRPRNQTAIDRLNRSASSGALDETIDFIFVSRPFTLKAAEVVTQAGSLSDHYPVVATVLTR